VNHVVPQDQLMAKTMEVIEKIKAQSPKAIAGIVRSVDAYFTDGVDGFKTEVEEFGKCFGTDDFKEGVAAFLQKRKAEFIRS
jgi:enoyl-CoA hydratase